MGITEIVGYGFVALYILSLVYVSLFCLVQLHLLIKYLNPVKKCSTNPELSGLNADNFPFITIQLPIYNEKYVVERLIDNIVKMDYPKDKFEIHILDDSTDDTTELSQKKVKEYADQGFQIRCITREARTGYKAGALRDAMSFARGEFIAIFDADFLPCPDFLIKTMASFTDPKVGVVQTRWEHINQNYSLLTELQAFQLNVHFTVEQKGRFNAGYMLQFNGTAGVWRRSCIDDAGGWEADTLTEDLDLSYRAQMKGWKIIFLEEVTAPAELPAEINGLKSQQYRWMKGGAETARKMLPKIWSSDLDLRIKIHATIHLLSSSIFIFVFIMSMMSFPMMYLLYSLDIDTSRLTIFMASLLAIIAVYFVANVGVAWPRENKLKMTIKFVLLFPVFLALSMGLAFHNSLAVISGWLGYQSAFIRTPKYGVKLKTDNLTRANYFSDSIDWVSVSEGLLSVYFFVALIVGLNYQVKDFLVLHFLLATGYLTLFMYAVQSKYVR
ncbi:MAG: glycosyltransferase [Saprospiraceae bacterium]|nr:glycosyltransferase [Saprospiraceae bacterium]